MEKSLGVVFLVHDVCMDSVNAVLLGGQEVHNLYSFVAMLNVGGIYQHDPEPISERFFSPFIGCVNGTDTKPTLCIRLHSNPVVDTCIAMGSNFIILMGVLTYWMLVTLIDLKFNVFDFKCCWNLLVRKFCHANVSEAGGYWNFKD